jgi:hypothetical protein
MSYKVNIRCLDIDIFFSSRILLEESKGYLGKIGIFYYVRKRWGLSLLSLEGVGFDFSHPKSLKRVG